MTYNFSAGPATLPQPVLEQVHREWFGWGDTKTPIVSISHRHPAFLELMFETQQNLRDLLSVPDRYRILFLAGGARAQFSAVPMNLLGHIDPAKRRAAYIDTGLWSQSAITEAKQYAKVDILSSAKTLSYLEIPAQSSWENIPSDAAYLHYTPNETVGGLEFHWVPEGYSVPLVADMSSNILSRPIDVNQFGIIYACAQKNLGSAGVTVVIIREDLLEQACSEVPSVLNYKKQAEVQSLYNTPDVFAIYVMSLVLKWAKAEGGVHAMEARNKRKAEKLYAAIDASDFYHNRIKPADRSRMNVIFTFADATREEDFITEAAQSGLLALRGHKLGGGGCRASLYNGMPESGVDALIQFMREFEKH